MVGIVGEVIHMAKSKIQFTPVNIRVSTKRKVVRVAKANRWKIGETIDAWADRAISELKLERTSEPQSAEPSAA